MHGQFASNGVDWWIGMQPEIFRPRAGERSVSLSLVDNAGQPVRGRV